MRYLAGALAFLGALAALVIFAVVAHVKGDDLICLGLVLGGAGVIVAALVSGRSLDDVL